MNAVGLMCALQRSWILSTVAAPPIARHEARDGADLFALEIRRYICGADESLTATTASIVSKESHSSASAGRVTVRSHRASQNTAATAASQSSRTAGQPFPLGGSGAKGSSYRPVPKH